MISLLRPASYISAKKKKRTLKCCVDYGHGCTLLNGGSCQHPEKSEPVSWVQIQPGITAWRHFVSISSSLSNMDTVWETDPTFVPQLSQDGWLALLAFLTETEDAARLKLTDTPIPPPCAQ